MKSKFFVFSGIIYLLGFILTKQLIFLYEYADDGINLLPINFFQYFLLTIAVLFGLIVFLISFFIFRKNKIKLGRKKVWIILLLNLLWIIAMVLLLNANLNKFIIPISILFYIAILYVLKSVFQINLKVFSLTLLLFGLASILFKNNAILIASLCFAIFPIIFGLSQINTKTHL